MERRELTENFDHPDGIHSLNKMLGRLGTAAVKPSLS